MIGINQTGDPGFYEEFLLIEKFKEDVLPKCKELEREGRHQELEAFIAQMALHTKPIKAILDEGAFRGNADYFAEFLLSQMIRNGSVKIKTSHEP